MKIAKIDKIKNLLLVLYNHWAIFPVIMAVVYCGSILLDYPCYLEVIPWIICSLHPIISRILANRCNRKRTFLVGTILLFAGTVAGCVFTSPYYAIYVIAMFVYTLCTLNMKFTHDKYLFNQEFPLLFPIVSSLIFILVLHTRKLSSFDTYYIYVNIILAVVYCIYFFLNKYVNEMKINDGSAGNMPSGAIFSSGFRALILFLGILVPVMIFISNLEMVKVIFDMLSDGLIAFLKFIISKLPTDDGTTADPDIIIKNFNLPEAGESDGLLGKILRTIFVLFIGAAVLFFVELLIVAIYRFIKELIFGRIEHRAELVSVNNSSDIREKISAKEKAVKDKKGVFYSFSTEERIRKLYYKTLMADKSFSSTDNSTVNEKGLITAREYGTSRQLEGFADSYEKARYSGQKCDKEDYKKMKESSK